MSARTFSELKSRFGQSCILFGGSREASKNCVPGGSHGKVSVCKAGEPGGSILGSGRSPGDGNATHSMGHMGPWGHKEMDMTK